jgi:hypothetical protein
MSPKAPQRTTSGRTLGGFTGIPQFTGKIPGAAALNAMLVG